MQHTECISEAEKYEGSLYTKKKKKTSPQEAWNQCIDAAANKISEAPQQIRFYIEKLGQNSNVPRNKQKFSNFVKNSFRMYNDQIIDELWTFLEKFKSDGAQEKEIAQQENDNSMLCVDKSLQQNELDAEHTEQEKKRKRKEMKKERKKMKRSRKELEHTEPKADQIKDETMAMKKVKKDKKKKKVSVG